DSRFKSLSESESDLNLESSRPKADEMTVWIARDDLPTGAPLTRKHFTRQTIRERTHASFYWPSDRSPEGMVVAVPIEFGQILDRGHLRDPADKPASRERTVDIEVRGSALLAKTIVPGVTFD